MARILPPSVFKASFEAAEFKPTQSQRVAERMATPEGLKVAVETTDVVGGTLADAITRYARKRAVLSKAQEGQREFLTAAEEQTALDKASYGHGMESVIRAAHSEKPHEARAVGYQTMRKAWDRPGSGKLSARWAGGPEEALTKQYERLAKASPIATAKSPTPSWATVAGLGLKEQSKRARSGELATGLRAAAITRRTLKDIEVDTSKQLGEDVINALVQTGLFVRYNDSLAGGGTVPSLMLRPSAEELKAIEQSRDSQDPTLATEMERSLHLRALRAIEQRNHPNLDFGLQNLKTYSQGVSEGLDMVSYVPRGDRRWEDWRRRQSQSDFGAAGNNLEFYLGSLKPTDPQAAGRRTRQAADPRTEGLRPSERTPTAPAPADVPQSVGVASQDGAPASIVSEASLEAAAQKSGLNVPVVRTQEDFDREAKREEETQRLILDTKQQELEATRAAAGEPQLPRLKYIPPGAPERWPGGPRGEPVLRPDETWYDVHKERYEDPTLVGGPSYNKAIADEKAADVLRQANISEEIIEETFPGHGRKKEPRGRPAQFGRGRSRSVHSAMADARRRAAMEKAKKKKPKGHAEPKKFKKKPIPKPMVTALGGSRAERKMVKRGEFTRYPAQINYNIPKEQKEAAKTAAIAAAKKHKVDPDLFVALIQAESAFDPHAVSDDNALGIGQMLPSTYLKIINPKGKIEDLFDQAIGLDAAAQYLKSALDRYKGDKDALKKAIASYNTGPANVKNNPLSLILSDRWAKGQTKKYVAKILAHMTERKAKAKKLAAKAKKPKVVAKKKKGS